jgi:hypothetical protein
MHPYNGAAVATDCKQTNKHLADELLILISGRHKITINAYDINDVLRCPISLSFQ